MLHLRECQMRTGFKRSHTSCSHPQPVLCLVLLSKELQVKWIVPAKQLFTSRERHYRSGTENARGIVSCSRNLFQGTTYGGNVSQEKVCNFDVYLKTRKITNLLNTLLFHEAHKYVLCCVAGLEVRYAITGGNRDGLFTIDQHTGVITLAAALDFEVHDKVSLPGVVLSAGL